MATSYLEIPRLQNYGFAPVTSVMPQGLLDQTAASLSGALRGELPSDVQDLLRQSAAEYGVAAGLPGSEFAGYRGLRNLGLTSLSRIQEAEKAITPFFISPMQAQQLSQSGAKLGLEERAMLLNAELDRQRLAAARGAGGAGGGTPISRISPTAGGGGGIPIGGTSAGQTAQNIYARYASGLGGGVAGYYEGPGETVTGTTPGISLAEQLGYTPEEWAYSGYLYQGGGDEVAGFPGYTAEGLTMDWEYPGGGGVTGYPGYTAADLTGDYDYTYSGSDLGYSPEEWAYSGWMYE